MTLQADITCKHKALPQTIYGTSLSVKNTNQPIYDSERFHNLPMSVSFLQARENAHASKGYVCANAVVSNGEICSYQSGVEEKKEIKANGGLSTGNGKLRNETDGSGSAGIRSKNANGGCGKESAKEARRNGNKGQLLLNSRGKTSEIAGHEDLGNQLGPSNNDPGTKIAIKKANSTQLQELDKKSEEGKVKLGSKKRTQKNRKGLSEAENIHSGVVKEKFVRSKRIIFKTNGNGLSKVKVDRKDPGLLCLNKKRSPSSNTSYRKNSVYNSLSSNRNSHSEAPSESNTRPGSCLQRLGWLALTVALTSRVDARVDSRRESLE